MRAIYGGGSLRITVAGGDCSTSRPNPYLTGWGPAILARERGITVHEIFGSTAADVQGGTECGATIKIDRTSLSYSKHMTPPGC